MTNIYEKLQSGQLSTAEALAIFDQLEPVDIKFMLGAWRGQGAPTGHSLDGMLEAHHWHGKRFESEEAVHPLVFDSIYGGTRNVNPAYAMPFLCNLYRIPFLKAKLTARLFQTVMPVLATARPCARLRMSTYRGKTSATMIYDHLPVNDVFRKIDDNIVLGLMDQRCDAQPFFFILRRE